MTSSENHSSRQISQGGLTSCTHSYTCEDKASPNHHKTVSRRECIHIRCRASPPEASRHAIEHHRALAKVPKTRLIFERGLHRTHETAS